MLRVHVGVGFCNLGTQYLGLHAVTVVVHLECQLGLGRNVCAGQDRAIIERYDAMQAHPDGIGEHIRNIVQVVEAVATHSQPWVLGQRVASGSVIGNKQVAGADLWGKGWVLDVEPPHHRLHRGAGCAQLSEGIRDQWMGLVDSVDTALTEQPEHVVYHGKSREGHRVSLNAKKPQPCPKASRGLGLGPVRPGRFPPRTQHGSGRQRRRGTNARTMPASACRRTRPR